MLLSLCSKSFSFLFLLNSCFVQLHAFNICLKLLKNDRVKDKHVWFQCNQQNKVPLGWNSDKWLGLEIPADSWEFLVGVGVCHPVLQILTLFHTKKCHFPHPFSDQSSKIHTQFKGWSAIRGHGLFGEGNSCATKIILVHTSCCVTAKCDQTKKKWHLP